MRVGGGGGGGGYLVPLVYLLHGGCEVAVEEAQRRVEQVEPCSHSTLVALGDRQQTLHVNATQLSYEDDDVMMTSSR